jgi:hypothetical protein
MFRRGMPYSIMRRRAVVKCTPNFAPIFVRLSPSPSTGPPGWLSRWGYTRVAGPMRESAAATSRTPHRSRNFVRGPPTLST